MRGRIWTAVLLAGLVAACSWPSPSAAQEGGAIAVILKVKNDVRQRGPGGGEWEEAYRGQILGDGHELRTGDDSFCALIFQDDKSLLKISSRTEVTVNASADGTGRLEKRIWVGVGGIWAQVTHQEETAFQIETPTSVASVKGSVCYDTTDAGGYTTLFGLEGQFEFSNRFGSVLVERGFKAWSDGMNPPLLSPTLPGETPTFAEGDIFEPEEPEGEGGQGGEREDRRGESEMRLGMEDQDGTRRELIIRYRERD